MRLTNWFWLLLPTAFSHYSLVGQENTNKWLICYGKLNTKTTKGYELLIVEPAHYTKLDVARFKQNNKKVLAYISLGEVNANAKHFSSLQNITLGKNEQWNSYLLDLRNSKTKAVLLKLVATALRDGYDGFLLDNIDNFGPYGQQKSQIVDLVALIKEIRARYNSIFLMQNAGFPLLDYTATYVDAILVESVATDYNFSTKNYQLKEEGAFLAYLQVLQSLKTRNLPLFIVDYADTKAMKAAVDRKLAATGLRYFIGQISLQKPPMFK